MPAAFNRIVGDTGLASTAEDRSRELPANDWDFFAVDVPKENLGLLRTALESISGNPDLFIQTGSVPTTDHFVTGGGSSGTKIYERSLIASTSEYPNWVPAD
jgi:hypothetical protein